MPTNTMSDDRKAAIANLQAVLDPRNGRTDSGCILVHERTVQMALAALSAQPSPDAAPAVAQREPTDAGAFIDNYAGHLPNVPALESAKYHLHKVADELRKAGRAECGAAKCNCLPSDRPVCRNEFPEHEDGERCSECHHLCACHLRRAPPEPQPAKDEGREVVVQVSEVTPLDLWIEANAETTPLSLDDWYVPVTGLKQFIERQQRAQPTGAAEATALPTWYGMNSPWPLHDVLQELIRAANILLDEKDYDGHGHERISTAKKRAREILCDIGLALPAPEPQQAQGDADEIARDLAAEIVQSLSDSEPTERSQEGMDMLRGTPLESMFVLDNDDIRKVAERVVSNALFDKRLAIPADQSGSANQDQSTQAMREEK